MKEGGDNFNRRRLRLGALIIICQEKTHRQGAVYQN